MEASTVSVKRELINVRVSRRVLWVGAQAYPLHNIARAQTIRLEPRRGLAFWRWLRAIALWVILGIGAVVVAGFGGATTVDDLIGLVASVVLTLVLISTVRLILALSTRTHFALVIETAGTPHTAVVSPDENLMTKLVFMIMDAIDNPAADFQMAVENFHLGDKITQFGNQNLGKVAT
jgi:hypothetical protein